MSSAKIISLPGQKNYQDVFPLVYDFSLEQAKTDDIIGWVKEERSNLLKKSANHGAILFRGFPIYNDTDFELFIDAFDIDNLSYDDTFSNAIRKNRTDRVFTANEAPPSVQIFLHHELAQTIKFPSHLFFFCEQAPMQGGQTTMCRSDILFEYLERELPEFIISCEQLGVRYANVMPFEEDPGSGQGRSWKNTLGVNDQLSAEKILSDIDYEWQWKKDGSLRVITSVLPSVRLLKNKRKIFFNQLIAAFCGWKDERNNPRKTIFYGDGSEISPQTMSAVSNIADNLTFSLDWQKGDIVFINNLLVLHGRKPYEGSRSVLASLALDKSFLANNLK